MRTFVSSNVAETFRFERGAIPDCKAGPTTTSRTTIGGVETPTCPDFTTSQSSPSQRPTTRRAEAGSGAPGARVQRDQRVARRDQQHGCPLPSPTMPGRESQADTVNLTDRRNGINFVGLLSGTWWLRRAPVAFGKMALGGHCHRDGSGPPPFRPETAPVSRAAA